MSNELKSTALLAEHRKSGARFVPFAGFQMPVQYLGILEEHAAVRTSVGIFDVSHMGELDVRGPRAFECVQRLITNDLSRIEDGQAQYTVACNPAGGILDDLIVYRCSPDRIFVCMNAGNHQKIADWFKTHEIDGATVTDLSEHYAQIAIQGPNSEPLIQRLVGDDITALKPFHFVEREVCGGDALIARTGYTGEPGVELFLPAEAAVKAWRQLLDEGAQPCGLGARDTLRLEMGYCLYGNDIDESTSPLEAGLSWVVRLKKGDFIGREALVQQKRAGIPRQLVGLQVLERAIPRQHFPILHRGEPVGEITSGTMSPTLSLPIAMGYVPHQLAEPGSIVEIQVRKRQVKAEVVRPPFYRRGQ